MKEASRAMEAESSARLSTAWDAELYFKFGAEHAQPALDLLTRIDFTPRRIVDLGCGPGVSTRMLRDRFPDAKSRRLQFRGNAGRGAARPPDMRFEETDIVDGGRASRPI